MPGYEKNENSFPEGIPAIVSFVLLVHGTMR